MELFSVIQTIRERAILSPVMLRHGVQIPQSMLTLCLKLFLQDYSYSFESFHLLRKLDSHIPSDFREYNSSTSELLILCLGLYEPRWLFHDSLLFLNYLRFCNFQAKFQYHCSFQPMQSYSVIRRALWLLIKQKATLFQILCPPLFPTSHLEDFQPSLTQKKQLATYIPKESKQLLKYSE